MILARRPARRWATAAALCGACLAVAAQPAREPRVFTLEGNTLRGAGADTPLPVGSLQKPFLVEAWARAHPGQAPPAFRCDARAGCWRPAGHGTLALEAALAHSCNTWFRALAADLDPELLADTLRARGFVLGGRLTVALAIGLPDPQGDVRIAPRALLLAYRELTRTPWPEGEALRPRLLAGLRAAALSGTARGLGQRGYWAKTGTVPALDGRPLATSGLALAIDDSGFGVLGLLDRGTGREAADALGPVLARLRPWAIARTARDAPPVARREAPPHADAPGRPGAGLKQHVRVRLFEALAPRRALARNLSSAPVATSGGFAGAGASLELRPGQRLSEGLWELSLPEVGLKRRLLAALEVGTDGAARTLVVARLEPQEYVRGVLAAEAPAAELRVPAGAAVLRFLAQGPRHADADVCDLTHCAFFVGRGPRVAWSAPRRVLALPAGRPVPPTDEAREWERIRALAREPGPAFWGSHCGGAPLTPYYVWGAGSREATPCPLHAPGTVAAWSREWPDDALRRAFGFELRDARVRDADGIWSLELDGPGATRRLRFDDAHRLLARELGWDALPSPAARVLRAARGYLAQGLGFGHRVGLCLDGSDGTRAGSRPLREPGTTR